MPDDARHESPAAEPTPGGRPRSSVLLLTGAALLVAGYGVRWAVCQPIGDDGSLTAGPILLTAVETGYGLGV